MSLQFPSLKQYLNLKLDTMPIKMALELTNIQLWQVSTHFKSTYGKKVAGKKFPWTNNIKIISRNITQGKAIHFCKFTAETEGQGENLWGLTDHRCRWQFPRKKLNHSDIPTENSSHKISMNHWRNSESSLQWHSWSKLTAVFPLASCNKSYWGQC